MTPHKRRRVEASACTRQQELGPRPLALWRRELGWGRPARSTLLRSSLCDLQLQASLCPHGRSAVVEVACHAGFVFVLTKDARCAVFQAASLTSERRQLCWLNASAEQAVHSIVLNAATSTVLAVASAACAVQVVAVPCEASSFAPCASGFCGAGQPVCGPAIRYPGWVEFDDGCRRALVFSPDTNQYRVFDLATYALLYCLPGLGVDEVKLGTDLLLTIGKQRSETCDAPGSRQQPVLPLQLLSAASGQLLAAHALPYAGSDTRCHVPQLLELRGAWLLFKQPLQPLTVYEALSLRCVAASDALGEASCLLHLEAFDLLLAVNQHRLATYTCKGEALVPAFEDHELWLPDGQGASLLTVTPAGWVVSYCRPRSCGSVLPSAGALHVSDARTGRLLARLEAPQESAQAADDLAALLLDPSLGGEADAAAAAATRAALTDVTCVALDEDSCAALFTGTAGGRVHVFSPGAS